LLFGDTFTPTLAHKYWEGRLSVISLVSFLVPFSQWKNEQVYLSIAFQLLDFTDGYWMSILVPSNEY
jgi:hypothetical protein